MHIIIIVLIAFVAFIVFLAIAALFIKKDYFIEREVAINKPNNTVFGYIKLAKNQQNYSKWWMMDPNKKMTYTGVDGTIGFVAGWDSNNKQVGKGEQEIKELVDGEKIGYEVRFIRPFEGTSYCYLLTKAINETQTCVKWGFVGKNKYPFNLVFSLIGLEKALGADIQESLDNLKKTVENIR
ncbi:MAG: SRPBCC family protein [Mucilaginibacter sp.]